MLNLHSDSGYWTPSATSTVWWTPSPITTAWWTPTTTSYWSTWTPTTTYTTCYTQSNVVVTITSILPCPETSTVIYWECCDQCETNCYNTPTPTTTPNIWVGTTTVTSHTTITPAQGGTTTTSNGLVIIYTSNPAAATETPSIVYAVSSDALGQDGGMPNLWSYGMVLAVVATVMILL